MQATECAASCPCSSSPVGPVDHGDALALDAADVLSRRLLGVHLQTPYVPRTAHLASAAPLLHALLVVCSRWEGELQPSSLADWRWTDVQDLKNSYGYSAQARVEHFPWSFAPSLFHTV